MAGSYPSPTFAGVTLNSPLSVANGGTGVTSVSGVAGAISAAFYTPTIADLRGLTSSTTATTCNVANFATAGDQGGGTFVVDAADTTSADNGGTIIVDAAGRRWYRQIEGSNYSVRWFGAKGDNSTDDTAAIQSAVDALVPNGKLFFAPGRYLVSNQITVSSPGVTFFGSGWSSEVTDAPTIGSIIVVGFTATTASNVFYVTASNVGFEDMEFWPNYQPTPASGWFPTTTPNAIQFYRATNAQTGGDDGRVKNLMMRGMSTGVYYFGADRGRIEGLYGQTFGPLLYIDGSYDVVKIHDVHHWGWWASDTNVFDWQIQNVRAIRFGRVDNPQLVNIFSYNCFAGLDYEGTITASGGGSQRGQLTNFGADSCYYGLLLNSDGLVTLQFSNLYVYCNSAAGPSTSPSRAIFATGSQIVEINGANAHITAPQGEAVRIDVNGSYFNCSQLWIESYNQGNFGLNAVYGGSGVTFLLDNPQINTANGNGIQPFSTGVSGVAIGISTPSAVYANYESWQSLDWSTGYLVSMVRCFGRGSVSVTASGYTSWTESLPVTYNTSVLYARASLGSNPPSAAVDIFDGYPSMPAVPVSSVSGTFYTTITGTFYFDWEVVGIL